jgi:hypothetical protein
MSALWNDKFYLKDTITPAYSVRADSDFLKLAGSFSLPLGFTFDNDNYSAKVVKNGMSAMAKDFYQSETFNFDLAPTLKAAAKVTPHKIIDLYTGIEIPLFSLAYSSVATKDTDHTITITGNGGNADLDIRTMINNHYSAKGRVYTSKVTAFPKLTFSAGFTVNYASTVALDFIFLTVTKDHVSIDSSVLLSIKR